MKAHSLFAILAVAAVAAWVLMDSGRPAPGILVSDAQIRPLESRSP